MFTEEHISWYASVRLDYEDSDLKNLVGIHSVPCGFLSETGGPDSTNWMSVEDYYIPLDDKEFITIGNFQNEWVVDEDYSYTGTSTEDPLIYYFIDSVTVIEADCQDCSTVDEEELNSWLEIELTPVTDECENDPCTNNDPDHCHNGFCKVINRLLIPAENYCFSHYRVTTETDTTDLISFPDFDRNGFIIIDGIPDCMPKGQITVKVELFRSPTDTVPCIIDNYLNCENDYCPCPEYIDDWLILTIEEGACGDSCQWKYEFNIPEPNNLVFVGAHITVTVNDEYESYNSVSRDTTTFEITASDSACVDSDSEVTIRIELYCHISDEFLCIIEKSVVCGCPCPPSREDWMTFDIDMNSPNCDSTQCFISHIWNMPEMYDSCYTHYRYIKDSTINDSGTLVGADFLVYDQCIDATTSYNAKLLLYEDGGSDTCTIDLHAYCNYKEHLYHCDTDCDTVDFIERDAITFTSPCDPSCKVTVQYESRDGCSNQDIYIKGIEVAKWNAGDTTACINCTMDTILKHSTFEIIDQNDMHFDPDYYPLYGDPTLCDTTWRVITSSCWTNWQRVVFIEGIIQGTGYARVVSIYEQCEADCCVRGFMVCKEQDSLKNKILTVTDFGLVIGDSCSGVTQWIESDSLGIDSVEVDCIYSCDFFEDVDETIYFDYFKISIKETKLELDPKARVLEYQTYQGNDIFRLSTRNAKNISNIILTIYDINGNDMDKIETEIAGHQQDFYFDISQYPSGTYVFNIVSESGQVATGKFIIVK